MKYAQKYAQAYERCVASIGDFVSKTPFDDVVIGLSGGIDSALVATMATDALGLSFVHGVLLPGPFSSEHSITDALELASNLGIDTKIISINAPFEAFAAAYEEGVGSSLEGVAAENTQARIRMMDIMALSNSCGWLMLNTGNKSEAAMGYSTLYGDTAGAFAPIGGVYKSDVFALARYRNEQALREGSVPPIPQNIIEKPPSAELSADQSDERSMGITYADLDEILFSFVERGQSAEEIIACGKPRDLVEMVVRRYEANAFKRAQEPPYVDIYDALSSFEA